MKKVIFGLTILAVFSLLVFVNQVGAKVERVAGAWDLTGSYVIEFTCTSGCSGTYPHTMNITSVDLTSGDFSGDGNYNPNPDYTWDVSGNVSDSSLTFTIVYTGLNPGYTVNASGTIASDGTLSGTATGPGQSFDWQSTSGAAGRFEGNHGQYVKSQENKKEAAQSRIGMPVQSKGHTK